MFVKKLLPVLSAACLDAVQTYSLQGKGLLIW